jgi:hypothetical protein
MSRSKTGNGRANIRVSERNRLILWTRAGGNCQYLGCNKPLLGDIVSGAEKLNTAYIAHIVAAAPDGPRGDLERSHALADDINNLMLLCDAHHRLIDREDVVGHPEARLQAMKAAHESRIASVTAIDANRGTHLLHYAARIGDHDCPVSSALSRAAVLPARYPLDQPLTLELKDCSFTEDDPAYWQFQQEHLVRQFNLRVGERLRQGEVRHLSVFAIAPQPLLITLGSLLSDIPDVEVRQISREPKGWAWRETWPKIAFASRDAAEGPAARVALNLGVSARIDDARITQVLGSEVPIWAVEAENPGNDVLGRPTCLATFRSLLRRAFAAIRLAHGADAEIHVFPALPVAMAIEVGRVRMPKADLPLVLWDERRHLGGFQQRLIVGR